MQKNFYRSIVPSFIALISLVASASALAQQHWENDPGGLFNPPPVEYNPIYFGYGSRNNVTYNKIDLQDGRTMQMQETALYDNSGQRIATATASGIGRVNGERDGGLIAGSIYRFVIDGEEKLMTYAWSVNVREGGRQSGWIEVDALSPRNDIVSILNQTKGDRLALFGDRIRHNNYERYTLRNTRLPSYMEEYYLDPGRDASKTAGKAKYYYTRDGLLTLINNIPETGSQRYGVGHDIASVGSKFYRDMNVSPVTVNIYPPSSYSAQSHTLNLVWGYVQTSGGESIFSWANERALVADTISTPPPPPPPTNTSIGTIEAEDYSSQSGIRFGQSSNSRGTYAGWIENRDSLSYDINVPRSGRYTLSLRVASRRSSGTIDISSDGDNIGSLNVGDTGSWDTWRTRTVSLQLDAGRQTLKLDFSTSASRFVTNIDWLKIE